ncbi:MAG: hypothetical protein DRP75_01770 [Candidatus Omnitrophota bacterium]|nr:MAG: hypothetical protein DRP75_01770 [Candidatus Omnitrophota bacterium]
MHIRQFRVEDSKEVEDLISSILKKEFPDVREAYPESDLKDINAHYAGEREGFFVAIEKGRVVGTVGIKEDDRKQNKALLRRIFVHPDYRGKGYGLALLDKAIEFCKKKGYHSLSFRSTDKMASANNLVQKRGFVERERLYFPLSKEKGVEIIKFVLNLSISPRRENA